ncbi:type II secretion system protein N [Sphingomonas profundi]|uniref:type II secretion system protein N n=1 Tax=Alterirhizorhabdus profundi TaxID=2681549 RepID=UPI0012E89F0F|nr:type II secretion system protein N [Sphingomonas profundi]
MRLVLDRRARRLLARLPRTNWYSVAELALLSVLALQSARLLLTLVTPVGPVGDWRPDTGAAIVSPAIFGAFDPFFRLAAPGGPAVVTGLDIKLFGIRADQASGRGSAILGLPNGVQQSVSVGEEVMPGVTLKSVAFDHVTILRGGADEQVFLDQSQPATVVSPPPPPPGQPAVSAAAPPPPAAGNPLLPPVPAVTASSLLGDARFAPRTGRNGVDGFTVQANGTGDALRAAGLQPGDVVISVNGARVSGAEDARRIQQQLSVSGEVTMIVERGGSEVPLRVRVVQ